jgi:hypothetical protein
MLITPCSLAPLPEVSFPFHDGTIETLLWDEENWTWYWRLPDGTRKRLRGVTKTVHVMSKGDVLVNWVRKVCLARLRELIVTRHLGPDNSLQLFVTELDAAIAEAKKENERVLNDAASVGKLAHAHVEKWIKAILSDNIKDANMLIEYMPINPADPADKRAEHCVNAALQWTYAHNVRFLSTEQPVFSREFEYAGTCDGTAWVDSCDDLACCPVAFKDHLSICDHKTSNATVPYLEYVWQVCSYQHALEEQTGERYEDRWINLYDKETGKFRAWRFAGREQYERGFKGFKRCLALTASKEQGQLELDDMRDARKVVLAIRAAEEKAAANKIACPKSTEYKGVKLSKCLPDGTQCQACKAKYEEKHPS